MVPTASGADGIILKARSYSRSGMNNALRRTDTKQRILDSAERLFADNGFEGTSLRTIIGDAKVNLAAIHYHYHSKEALVDAVILRHRADQPPADRTSGRRRASGWSRITLF